MANCKLCGAPIIFIRILSTGRLMPCDERHIGYQIDPNGKDRLINIRGEVFACTIENDKSKAEGFARMSHYATCPQADRFRKRQQRNGKQRNGGEITCQLTMI